MANDVKNNMSVRGLTKRHGDIRRTNNFILTIEGVTNDNNLSLVVQQAFIPRYNLQVLEFRRGVDSKKLPGAATWTGGTITILDTLSKDELEALHDWAEETYDPKTGKIGIAEKFKKTGTLTEYASDGTLSRSWTLEGMWISEFDYGQLDASTSELKRVSFTIQIDPPTTSGIRPTYKDGYED